MEELSTVTEIGTADGVFDKTISARFNGSWRYVFGFQCELELLGILELCN